MPGPLGTLRIVHNAIRYDVRDLERAIIETSTPDPAAISALATRLEILDEFLKDHEAAEEQVLFPALEEKAPRIVRAYELDHRSNDVIMADLQRTLIAARGNGGSESLVRDLLGHAIALRATMLLHLMKEEEHLLVLADEYFAAPEQGALVGRMAGHAPPEKQPRAHAFIFRRISPEERAIMLTGMRNAAPPQAFAHIVRIVSDALGPVDWADLQRRVPDLPAAPAFAL